MSDYDTKLKKLQALLEEQGLLLKRMIHTCEELERALQGKDPKPDGELPMGVSWS